MDPLGLVLLGIGVIAAGGLVSLALVSTPRVAAAVAVVAALLGGAVGLWASLVALAGGWSGELAVTWQVPGGGLVVGLDPLSAFFLCPLLVLGPLCAVYGRRYLVSSPLPAAELDLLLASMALVLVARHALLFLVAWEAMTVLAYLLVTREHGSAEVRRAGWAYLIASHVAMMALLALFVALGARAGGQLDFSSLARAWRMDGAGATGILLLALLGFGIKAGVAGLHVWLPEAHAAAPSHVSALMSGVLIKLGLYGLLRTALLVSPGPWFGLTLMILGLVGALLGIGLALYQRDLKRVLAYSSVENIGVILLGVGLGFWGRAHGDRHLAALAFAGGLLHLWNHSAMKGLLFLSAGSVLHATDSKDIERLGGLMRPMRWTGAAFLVGALAIAALPPLNGLTGEWLLYRALMRVSVTGPSAAGLAAIFAAAALALVGGLALFCFVRLVGVVLLGAPRSEAAARAHESPAAMIAPLLILAAICLSAGFAAPWLVAAQAPLLAQLEAGGSAEATAAGGFLMPLVVVGAGLLAATVAAAAVLARRASRAERAGTWDCGYAAPTGRMQYTGRAFSELFTRILPAPLRLKVAVRAPVGLFPASAAFSSDTTDPLTRCAYEPFLSRAGDRFARLRFLQQGNVHIYILYIVATALAGLGWVAVHDWLAT